MPTGRGRAPSAAGGRDAGGRAGAAPATAAAGRRRFGDYARTLWSRVLAGQSGVLPVVLGVILIAVIFQSQNAKFLSAGNLVNLLVQGSVFMLIGMGEVFVLLLGEIDLSLGFVAGIGGDRGHRCWCSPASTGHGGRRSSPALAGHRGARRLPGHADHPAAPALLRRHAGRACWASRA